ncbi:MAG: hypothetical protein HQL97_02120 [Magnetococcales bacterium]|nr:hypothetical protein [Magnetococcales bacterium]
MMNTTAAYGVSSASTTTSTSNKTSAQSADELRTDFLKLLTAQLQYQDPLEPVQNTEFTSQMAQFTGLGEQQKSNELLEKLIAAQGVNQLNQAVSYIGKTAVVDGDQTTLTGGVGSVRFDMPSAGTATINIYDANNRVVESVEQKFTAGTQKVDLQGSDLPDGTYRFAVSMVDASGNVKAVPTLEAGVVKAVINDATGVVLEMNGRKINIADVRQVEQG